jgi:hypothetical protein
MEKKSGSGMRIPDHFSESLEIDLRTKNTRVVDPYSFFPDPDPEFDVGDLYGSRALMTKN